MINTNISIIFLEKKLNANLIELLIEVTSLIYVSRLFKSGKEVQPCIKDGNRPLFLYMSTTCYENLYNKENSFIIIIKY